MERVLRNKCKREGKKDSLGKKIAGAPAEKGISKKQVSPSHTINYPESVCSILSRYL